MATISIYDHATGETIVRDMNDAELAELADQAQLAVEKKAEEEAIAAEKAETKAALLERLGITIDEAKLLLS
jgi:hypothetical protein